MSEEKASVAAKRALVFGLQPKQNPLGDSHHCDVPMTDEDRALGDALAWYLGTLFSDIAEGYLGDCAEYREEVHQYWYHERTSIDEWSRIARALRIHGLAICNRADAPVPEPVE